MPPTIGAHDSVSFGRVCLRSPDQFRRLLDDRNVDQASFPMVATNKRGAPERFQADGSLRSTQPTHRPVTSTVNWAHWREPADDQMLEGFVAGGASSASAIGAEPICGILFGNMVFVPSSSGRYRPPSLPVAAHHGAG